MATNPHFKGQNPQKNVNNLLVTVELPVNSLGFTSLFIRLYLPSYLV